MLGRKGIVHNSEVLQLDRDFRRKFCCFSHLLKEENANSDRYHHARWRFAFVISDFHISPHLGMAYISLKSRSSLWEIITGRPSSIATSSSILTPNFRGRYIPGSIVNTIPFASFSLLP